MKICYISDLFEPFTLGGAETYLNRLVDEVSKHVEVVVISTIPNNCRLPPIVNKKNVTLYRFSMEPLFSIFEYSDKSFLSRYLWQIFNFWNLRSFRKIKNIIKLEKPDVVHTHNFKGLSSSVFSAVRNESFSRFHTVHDYNLISPWSNLMRWKGLLTDFTLFDKLYINYMQSITKSTDVVIFPSSFAMKLHKQLGFFKNSCIKVVPNGIPIKKVSCTKKYDQINILFVGKLSYYKGVQVLIDAFKKCYSPNLKLNIVGDGTYLPQLKHLAGDDSRIIFHGRVSDTILEELYCKSNFFVIPSLWYEVLPVVIQEAMIYGSPVVGSKIGGILDLIIDDYNGYLFRTGSSHDLAEIIDKLCQSSDNLSRLGKNCSDFIQSFDIASHAKSLIGMYHDSQNSFLIKRKHD